MKKRFGLPTMRDILFSGEGGQYFRNQDYTEESPWGWLNFAGTRRDYKKESGDPATQSLIMSAVNWMGTQLIEAPCCVYEYDGPQKLKVEDHPIEKLLRRPTPFFSGGLLYKSFALPWFLYGNVYWYKVRDGTKKVVEIWPLRSEGISPAYSETGREYLGGYFYRVEGIDYFIRQEDLIHFRFNLDPKDSRMGISPLVALYRELFADNERANFQSAMLANMGVAGTIITPDNPTMTIPEPERKRLKREFEADFTKDNRGRVMVSSAMVKALPIAVEPDKMALEVLAKLPEERVAAVLGIPAAVLNFGSGLMNTNYATMKELREQAYEGAVIPTQRLIAQELDGQLLPEFEPETTKKFCQFDLTDVRVLQEDNLKLTQRTETAWKSGLIMRSEGRDALKLPVDEKRDAVFQASAGTALIPEDKADGQSLEPTLSIFDQQRARQQGSLDAGGGGAPQGQSFPLKEGDKGGAPPPKPAPKPDAKSNGRVM